MLVSRLITRTSGARSSSIRRASPQGQAKPAGAGIRPLARSAMRTYARASPTYVSRSPGSPGCGRTWSTPRPVITSPHRNRVTRIGGCRRELPGRSLVWNQSHLRRILRQYETCHNQHRPHRSPHGAAPLKPLPEPVEVEQYRVRRRALAGAMINEYRLVA